MADVARMRAICHARRGNDWRRVEVQCSASVLLGPSCVAVGRDKKKPAPRSYSLHPTRSSRCGSSSRCDSSSSTLVWSSEWFHGWAPQLSLALSQMRVRRRTRLELYIRIRAQWDPKHCPPVKTRRGRVGTFKLCCFGAYFAGVQALYYAHTRLKCGLRANADADANVIVLFRNLCVQRWFS